MYIRTYVRIRMYVYIERDEKSEPQNNLNSLKRSNLGEKKQSGFARDE